MTKHKSSTGATKNKTIRAPGRFRSSRVMKVYVAILLATFTNIALALPDETSSKSAARGLFPKVHTYDQGTDKLTNKFMPIKVVPKKGKPYYLVAEDGHENFMGVDEPRFLIPKWTIYSWK